MLEAPPPSSPNRLSHTCDLVPPPFSLSHWVTKYLQLSTHRAKAVELYWFRFAFKGATEAGEIAQWAQCLSREHEDLILIPTLRTHIKVRAVVYGCLESQ